MKWAIFALMLSGVLMFQQKRYDVQFQRLVVDRYDGSIVEYFKTHNFKYNRTNAAVNVTVSVLESLTDEILLEIQAHRFVSNEYRPFPIRFQTNLCKAASANDFGLGELFKCGNISDPCSVKKGVYRMCNWCPVATKFPPHVPSGSYKADLTFIYKTVKVVWLNLFIKIMYPEV